MEPWLQMAISIVAAVFASTGFWTFVMKRSEKKDVKTQMLIGLGHDRILCLGAQYITKGWVTPDEYENLYEYLYKPYHALGGNGSAERIMEAVKKLPIQENKNA